MLDFPCQYPTMSPPVLLVKGWAKRYELNKGDSYTENFIARESKRV